MTEEQRVEESSLAQTEESGIDNALTPEMQDLVDTEGSSSGNTGEKKDDDESTGQISVNKYKNVVRQNTRLRTVSDIQEAALDGIRKASQSTRDMLEAEISEQIKQDEVIWQTKSKTLTRIKQMGTIIVLGLAFLLLFEYENNPTVSNQIGAFFSDQLNTAMIVILVPGSL